MNENEIISKNNPRVAAETQQIEELTQTLQRVQADFENYRKRMHGEMDATYQRGRAAGFKEILAFLDTLDAAIAKVKDVHQKDLENLRSQLLKILAQNGVKPMQVVGKSFDPFTSECIMQSHDEKQEDEKVVEEFQRGYFFHDDVLRTAKVKVNKRETNLDDMQSNTPKQGGSEHE